MSHRALSPQLLALSAELRVMAAFIDAWGTYGRHCPELDARVDTAILIERRDGAGWNATKAEQLLERTGWRNAEGIYNAAGIPEKHWRVLDLSLWSDPTKYKGRMFTIREISDLTGHPLRTVDRWLSDDMPRLRGLAEVAEVAEVA